MCCVQMAGNTCWRWDELAGVRPPFPATLVGLAHVRPPALAEARCGCLPEVDSLRNARSGSVARRDNANLRCGSF